MFVAASCLPLAVASAVEPWVFDAGFQRTPLRVTSEAPYAVKVLSSGKILVYSINGGFLTGAAGQRIGAIVRLDPTTGAIDPTWQPDPTLTAAGFNGVAEGPGGKIYYATALNGELARFPSDQAINRVIRLNADGSRDTTFNSPIFGIASRFLSVQPDGKLLVCSGSVNVIGTPPAGSILQTVRLNADGSRDTSFQSPNFQLNAGAPPASVESGNYFDTGVFSPPAIDPATGKIYFAGTFRFVNDQPRKGIVRCHPDGTLDTSFVPTGLVAGNAGLTVRGIVVQPDGKVVIGGTSLRTAAGGATRYNLLRFNTDGTLDPTFTLVPTTTSTGTALVAGYFGPRSIGALPDGSIQTSDTRVLRFQANGATDPTFTPLAFSSPAPTGNAFVAAFVLSVDPNLGTVFLAHPTSRYALLNGVPVNSVTKLTAAGAIDPQFVGPSVEAESFNPRVQVLAGGKLLVSGAFDAFGPNGNATIARLFADGTRDATYALETLPFADKKAVEVASLPDGSAYVLYSSGSVTAYSFSNLVRLGPTGSIDTTFRPSTALQDSLGLNPYDGTSQTFNPLQIQPAAGGKLHLLPSGDAQTTLLNAGIKGLTRVNSDGTEDPSVPALGFPYGFVQRDLDNTLLGVSTGYFQRIGRTADGGFLALISVAPFPSTTNAPYQFRICKIRTDGSVDPGFNAPSITSLQTPSVTYPLLFDPVTGAYLQPPLGTYDFGSATFPITAACEASDGSVYVLGDFRFPGGSVSFPVGRFAPNGSWDTTFTPPSPWAQNLARPARLAVVSSITADPAGNVWVAGRFDTLGGVSAPGVARLTAAGALDASFSLNGVGFHDSLSDVTEVVFAARKAYLIGTFRRPGETFPFAVTRIVPTTPEAPVITSALPPAVAVVGVPYAHQFSATALPAAQFTVTSGTLPAGLTLTSSGLLSGTPAAGGSLLNFNLTVSATNGAPPAATQSFAIRLVSTASSYLAGFGLSGADAAPTIDFARDGLPNLLKYALGLNPTVAVGSPLVPAIRTYAGTRYASLIFPRSALATDLTYLVEATDNLGANPVVWTELARSSAGAVTTGVGFVGETGTAPNFQVEVRDTVAVPNANPPHRFLRLRVTMP